MKDYAKVKSNSIYLAFVIANISTVQEAKQHSINNALQDDLNDEEKSKLLSYDRCKCCFPFTLWGSLTLIVRTYETEDEDSGEADAAD